MDKIYCSTATRAGERLEIRIAAEEHIEEMLALEKRSIDPATFCEITREELAESIRDDAVLAAFCADRIVAFNVVLRPRESERNLAPDIGKPFESVATFDGVVVAPEYRGNGLQRRFIEIAAELAGGWGADLLAATVAPSNAPSRRNFALEGFSELGEFPKYGSTRIMVVKAI